MNNTTQSTKISVPKKVTKLKLVRNLYHKKGTIGTLHWEGEEFCRTLERPFNENKPDDKNTPENDSGCIPEGIYSIKKDYTGKFQYFQVLDVPNRKYIEIHQANKINDLMGCIALGEKVLEDFKYRGVKYDFWLTNSKKTCEKLKRTLPEETLLEITKA